MTTNMKVCPVCKHVSSDEAKYCVMCKTNLEHIPPEDTGRWSKLRGKGWGCLIIIAVAIIILLFLTLLPGSIFNANSKEGFGGAILPFFGRGTRTEANAKHILPAHSLRIIE